MTPGNAFLREVRLDPAKVTSFEDYPFCVPAIRNLTQLPLHPKVTFLVGENGAGKSTLIEAMAISLGLNAEGGSRNFNFMTQETDGELSRAITLVRGVRRPRDYYFLRAESFYTVATEIEKLGVGDGYGTRALHKQSHGESFLALFRNRFRGNGLYLLDEPEAALSPARQMSLLSLIHELSSDGSQFVIATHSPIIMAYPEATIYLFLESGIVPAAYEDTEHYRITANFFNRRDQMLKILLS
jgi:predicted ATPase